MDIVGKPTKDEASSTNTSQHTIVSSRTSQIPQQEIGKNTVQQGSVLSLE